jgi:inner membrane protein YidH
MANESEKSAAKIDVNTMLAIDRNRVAYDRTMLAWIRTAISLITFGFSIYSFFALQLRRGEEDGRLIGPREFGLTMVIIGLLSLVLGAWDNRNNMQELRAMGAEIRYSRAGILAALIALLGILALIAMIIRH